MKISKLFHWLYAFVMFLPIFAIGVTCGYAMFNKNAYKSYYGSELNKVDYENINVNSMETGKEYYFLNQTPLSQGNYLELQVSKFTDIQTNTDYENAQLRIFYNSGLDKYVIRVVREGYSNFDVDLLYKQYKITYTSTTTYTGNNNYIYKAIYYENGYIDNVFYYSVDKVTESPLFSWAYDSFLVAPFSYIVALFSIPTNHVIVELLSYWLAISIIWLVFDLIMYVPLLVHRWLDKGVLE